jgi:P27 family predicted phage terminase small subunit
MKGRKPALKVLEGGASLRRCPGPPMWLSLHSKREWRRVAPRLHQQGRLSPSLSATLESYCVAVGAIREAEETLAAEGRIIAGDKGPALHPAFKMLVAAMREARLLAAELRITREAVTDPDEGKGVGWDSDLLA